MSAASYGLTNLEAGQIGGHACAVLGGIPSVVCWGSNSNGQSTLPKGLKTGVEPSCRTEHPQRNGPSSCTSCADDAHFTMMDPATNTGTCTPVECPFCKPKACCDDQHKHFVLNTETEEGVCVRMNDDCTPVCVPHGDAEPHKPRVCSKGCNQLVKIDKEPGHAQLKKGTKQDSDLFDMMVCEANKHVTCKPQKPAADGNGMEAKCVVKKEVDALVRCNFTQELWNLGPTCIANQLHNSTSPQCPEHVNPLTLQQIPFLCRNATAEEGAACTRIAMSY